MQSGGTGLYFGLNVPSARLQRVVKYLGCQEVRQKGSHVRYETPDHRPFGIPANKETVSPGIFEEVAQITHIPKDVLRDCCLSDRALKDTKRSGLYLQA